MLPLMRKTQSQGITVVEKRNSKLVWLANGTDYARAKSCLLGSLSSGDNKESMPNGCLCTILKHSN